VLRVLAGVNGAGKSSIGGAALRRRGATWFNPDELSTRLQREEDLGKDEADALAWQEGRARLERALSQGRSYAFETTLGATTFARMLREACATHDVMIWYCGLASPELHIARVKARVAAGGHDIPEHKIRSRWNTSIANLIALSPHVHTVQVYDNSTSVEVGMPIPSPLRVALVEHGRLIVPDPMDAEALVSTPVWVRPLIASLFST
jgi:predicted ABC-type ATPase